jgi:hypothetical protein
MLYKSAALNFNQRWTMNQFENIVLFRSTKHVDVKSIFLCKMLYSSTNFFVVVSDALYFRLKFAPQINNFLSCQIVTSYLGMFKTKSLMVTS